MNLISGSITGPVDRRIEHAGRLVVEFEEFEALLQDVRTAQAGRTLPEGFQLFDSWRASDADIEHVEDQLDIRLPEKYKTFMRRHGGGVFQFVELLPVVSPNDRSEDLIEVNRGQFRAVDFIAVSPVGTGDWWGFSVSEGVCGDAVNFWGHEDRRITGFAPDFLEFVARQGLRAGG
jgi:hypothetical protein